MNVFATVKTSINTREAAARYGVEVNHHGKALCPFHNDRHPSLFVDDDHYHCYACGEHGDVIDFTSKLYGLSMLDAAKKLAYDFGITQDKPPTRCSVQKPSGTIRRTDCTGAFQCNCPRFQRSEVAARSSAVPARA